MKINFKKIGEDITYLELNWVHPFTLAFTTIIHGLFQ